MFVIITYDVDEKRVAKVCKKLRAYLDWTQNSVFEGEITKGKLIKCLRELELLTSDSDSIYVYKVENPKHIVKEVMGQDRSFDKFMF
ncbi:CRISPR-associated endonuclease Cas2 [Paenibacillus cisolokensis]|uniref:CRISPR-associated endonuclease Cas2 n=1 Tax=Paenibacillus cisolokensis TaxID=1658519 RepID=UPI003D2E49AF